MMHTGQTFKEVQDRLRQVIAQEPGVTSNGFEPFYPHSNKYSVAYFEAVTEQRRELVEDEVERFDKACLILRGIGKSAYINKRFHTYRIKHGLEEYLRVFLKDPNICIGNGATIAAAIDCGFKYEQYGGSALINISDEDYFKLRAGPPMEEVTVK
jgi:hypothetical protein